MNADPDSGKNVLKTISIPPNHTWRTWRMTKESRPALPGFLFVPFYYLKRIHMPLEIQYSPVHTAIKYTNTNESKTGR